MPGAMTDYLEDTTADLILSATAWSVPGTVYFGLFTVLPADDGTGGTEVSGNNYSRVAITNNSTNWPSGGSPKQNGTDITMPTPSGSWGTIIGWGLWDASTSGNLLFKGFFAAARKEFTADASTDLFSCVGHGYSAGDTVVVEANSGTLPSGVTEGTIYYVISSGLATDAFKISTSSGGSAVDISASGSGMVTKVQSYPVSTGFTFKVLAGALKIYFY